ncbi:MAG: hypothetical protein ACM3MG_11045 [Bacillota bacterium]
MNYKTNRLNHDFQITYFLAGSCHTPDGAYALLCDLKEDRKNALKTFEAHRLREQAKRQRAEARLKDADENTQLEAKADLLEMEALAESQRKNYEGAVAELQTIENCMQALMPHRRFKHLPDAQAHEAAQYDEWKFELIHRATNSLLTTGTIPTDQFATMRLHPAFQAEIWPEICKVRNLLHEPNGNEKMLLLLSEKHGELLEILERNMPVLDNKK